jgi:C1A family cysteine protease
MKTTIAITTILSILTSTLLFLNHQKQQNVEIPSHIATAFDTWKLTHKRLYATPEEHNHRLSVFAENHKYIEEVNSQNLGMTLAHNLFSDLSQEEFSARYLQKADHHKTVEHVEMTAEQFTSNSLEQQGTDFNWCTSGICSAVRLQGQCVAGYAFAAAKAIEYSNNIAKRSFEQWLSPQELIDCSANFNNGGCSGGYVSNSITYAKTYGLSFDKNYPYTDVQGPCKGVSGQFKPAGYFAINGDVNSFLGVMQKSPFSVGIDASSQAFRFYSTGIFPASSCGTSTTHFMTMIGNGQNASGQTYWRLENSWGTSWGTQGYMFLQALNGVGNNSCGVLNLGVANVLTSSP